jgi:predicted anti-sigma-YlaC factor YlaD
MKSACWQWLQQYLDERSAAAPLASREHLQTCSQCQELFPLIQQMKEALRRWPAPQPPADLSARIVRQVLAQQRRLRQERRVGALAAAACLLLPLVLSWLWPAAPPAPGPQAVSTPSASLAEEVRQAQAAVTALTEQLAQNTRQQAQLMRRVAAPVEWLLPSADPPAVPETLTQATKPLRELREGVSAGLEPLAQVAQQAWTYLRRELPGEPAPSRQN